MSYLKSFYETWDALAQDSGNQDLYTAIDSWCRTIPLPKEATKQIPNSIKQFLKDSRLINWASFISEKLLSWSPPHSFNPLDKRKTWEKFQEYIPDKLREYLNSVDYYSTNKRQDMDIKTKTTFVLLIAFILTGIALLLYFLNQKTSEEQEQRSSHPSQPVATPPPRAEEILVLVVSARQEDILQSLKTNGRVMPNEGELLYQVTQALWLGSQASFSQSELEKWFSGEHSVQEEEKSEYDICFVKIELAGRVAGFEPNVNQVDRNDAFRQLPEISKSVKVSPRLPSIAYENTGVYSR